MKMVQCAVESSLKMQVFKENVWSGMNADGVIYKVVEP